MMPRRHSNWLLTGALLAILMLGACGQPQAAAPAATSAPAAPTPAPAQPEPTAAEPGKADLSGIKTYLLDKATALKGHTATLKAAGDRYYDLAKGAGFDYNALLSSQRDQVAKTLQEAKDAWKAASPGYEQIEGIVAGVPSLAEYDVILDAGGSAADDPENAVPFDLTLPDGRVLEKPGNLFGLAESTLWGTRKEFVAADAEPDLDGNGTVEFGEALPDANMLKGTSDELDRYAGELLTAAQGWQPTESDAFTALVVMIPTMSEYFESWKQSRFVAGDASTQTDFVAISRLADIQDILSGLQVVYGQVSPMVATVDPTQDKQTAEGLDALKLFVADVYTQEQGGKRFSAEEADLLGAEAQNRATALAGQISQVAAQLNVPIQN
jgi:hypothetical protein